MAEVEQQRWRLGAPENARFVILGNPCIKMGCGVISGIFIENTVLFRPYCVRFLLVHLNLA